MNAVSIDAFDDDFKLFRAECSGKAFVPCTIFRLGFRRAYA
ncbi:MAG: hypothetical protein Q8K65_10025 [Alphaproteobacteria bacterium]|nr:hypothetical protein [Alphaproteobacteria bacterium]